jgi:hypothetical protein
VQARPQLEADASQFLPERHRSMDRPAGAVELLDHPAGQLVMHAQQLPPAPVAGAAGSEHGGHRLGPPALVELGRQRLGDRSGRPIG